MKKMARDGLLSKAKKKRYHLEVDVDSDAGPQFALVAEQQDRRRGMLSRAARLRHQPTERVRSDSAELADGMTAVETTPEPTGQSIRQAEDREVLAEIEGLVSQRKLDADSLRLSRGEGRLGILSVVSANLFVAVLAGVAVLFVTRIFTTRENEITLATETIASTESRLIQELIAESQQALDAKNAEINMIQARLEQVAASRAELESSLNEQLADRTQQLREQLEAELAAERQRLEAQGATSADIEARLAELQAAREDEVATRLAEFEEELQAEFTAQVEVLQSQAGSLQAELDVSRAERAQLEAEAAEREAELQQQLAEEQAQSAAEIAAAEERAGEAEQALSALQQNQERSALLQDQLRASYETAFERLAAADYPGAIAALDRRSQILSDPLFLTLPGFEERRAAENRITAALRRIIESEAIAVDDLSALETQLSADAQRLEAERVAEVEALEAQIAELQQLLANGASEVQRLETQLTQERTTRAALETERAALGATVEALEAELDTTEATTASQAAQLEAARAEIATLNERNAELNARMNEVTAGSAVSAGERAELVARIEELETNLTESNRRLAIANRQLADAEERAELSGQSGDELEMRVAALQAELETLRGETEELEIRLESAIEQRDRAREDARVAQERAEEALRNASAQIAAIEAQAPAQRFVGTVSLVLGSGSGATLTVRVLVDDEFNEGDAVEIRRAAAGFDRVIARGVIERVRDTAVVVALSEEPTAVPQVSDAVFAVPDL